MTLTSDQRWLLLRMGGWPIVWALADDHGLENLRKQRSGYYGTALEGAPEWMHSYEVQAGKIYSPSHPHTADPKVTLTVSQIGRFAKALPAALRDELRACGAASIGETMRTSEWCHCPDAEKCMWRNDWSGPRHHPTDAEDQAHIAEYWRIRDWEDDLLGRALGFAVIDEPEPIGQLELFEVA